jgi:hypothetical protein
VQDKGGCWPSRPKDPLSPSLRFFITGASGGEKVPFPPIAADFPWWDCDCTLVLSWQVGTPATAAPSGPGLSQQDSTPCGRRSTLQMSLPVCRLVLYILKEKC